MASVVNKLSARGVATTSEVGWYGDGGGLWLVVGEAGRKSWMFRYRHKGSRRQMGLGSARVIGLAEAREVARLAREALAAGRDPIVVRDTPPPAEVAVPTFGEVADQLIADYRSGWRGAKTEVSWKRSLVAHAAPIRDMPVCDIGYEDVLAVLRPYWGKMPESAGKLRERIERVLDAARARGFIASDRANPARWKGHLELMLPKRKKLVRGHQRALDHEEMPEFMRRLRASTAPSALALEWNILTAARESMTLEATWGEVRGDVWIVPARRMKEDKDHRVPLSGRCLEILDAVRPSRGRKDGWIFPNMRGTGPMSNATMDRLLERMGVDATPHGFRSTFRDWAGDETGFPRELAEMALAHKVGDDVEGAYRRKDALAKRRELMNAWALYCAGEPR